MEVSVPFLSKRFKSLQEVTSFFFFSIYGPGKVLPEEKKITKQTSKQKQSIGHAVKFELHKHQIAFLYMYTPNTAWNTLALKKIIYCLSEIQIQMGVLYYHLLYLAILVLQDPGYQVLYWSVFQNEEQAQ